MSSRSKKLQQLVEDTLNTESEIKLSDLLRRAARIARLRGDYRNLAWVEREMLPHKTKLAQSDLGQELLNYIPSLDSFKAEWQRDSLKLMEEREIPEYDDDHNATGEVKILAITVPEMEQALESIKHELAIVGSIPTGIPGDQLASYYQRAERSRYAFSKAINDRQAILDRIRLRVLSYLNQTEALLAYQEQSADVFESAKRIVESELSSIAPDVLSKLNSAQERLADGSAEAFSHALTTCRRMLKAFADSLYPATVKPVIGADGKERKLGEDQYIARLWQYIYELSGRHSSTNITLAVLEQLGDRIDKVYALTNKGVHDQITEHEAKQCVIQTFLVLADILAFRKAKNSSLKTP